MKVIKEVGLRKSFRFVFYSFYVVIYHKIIDHLLFFPLFRKCALTLVGAKIGKNVQIMDVKFFNWHHLGPGGLEIGENSFIGDGAMIDLYNHVTLGKNVTIGQSVTLLTHTNVGYEDHPLQKYFPKKSEPLTIEEGCFIGAGTTIMPGIIIGKESFIAAGSVVTKSIPTNSLFGGVPAKLIRKIK